MLLCIVYAMLFVDSVDIHRGWLLKKVMGRNALEIFMPSVDSVMKVAEFPKLALIHGILLSLLI